MLMHSICMSYSRGNVLWHLQIFKLHIGRQILWSNSVGDWEQFCRWLGASRVLRVFFWASYTFVSLVLRWWDCLATFKACSFIFLLQMVWLLFNSINLCTFFGYNFKHEFFHSEFCKCLCLPVLVFCCFHFLFCFVPPAPSILTLNPAKAAASSRHPCCCSNALLL